MCSIAGILSSRPVDAALLQDMNACMKHRGPDGEGYYDWDDGNTWLQLAHNRLSIIDTTPASGQPFRYRNRYVIVYNGEIYNYKELRTRLAGEGQTFSTTGDTEVLAAAYAQWGEECLQHLDGMFAFVIWDEEEKKLFAARDRFGEKPFYYHYNASTKTLCFASEIKALLRAGIGNSLNNRLLYNFLTLGHTRQVQFPENTFYENIFQLPPSNLLSWQLGKGEEPVVARYFDLDKESVHDMGEQDALEQFATLLRASVQKRMRADVPTGTSLSGGLDSSSITALCHAIKDPQYSHQAFSAVFPGFEKDESPYINEMEKAFDLSIHRTSPTAQQLAENLQALVRAQGEPFGSASVFAQWMVFGTAKQHGVTVLLDGQGADEALAGYTRYTHWYLQEMIRIKGWAWADAESVTYKGNGFLEQWGWKNRIAAMFPSLTAHALRNKAIERQKKEQHISKAFRQQFADEGAVFKPVVEKLNDIQYHDLMIMGLEELLRYADRNSMAHSREVRLPFLSHQLVQFILSLPPHFRMRDGFNKWILRKSMEASLPAAITWRKGKTGFEPPQKTWMQDASIQELIRESRRKLVEEKILDPSALRRPIVPAHAHDADGTDFRCLIAGLWIA